jgi:hypothetical protein
MKTLRLYSRAECDLCHELAAALEPIIEGRARLELVDIDDDLVLKRRYGWRIPVLVGGGRELSAFPLDVAAVEAFLASPHG